jgi:glycosyltransferase involved in cell wall biosynthesis
MKKVTTHKKKLKQPKEVKEVKVTFCVPAYNKVEYLADAIESFLEQKYDNKELLIGDDASTDYTEQLATWYANKYPNIRYIRVNANIGVANMRNLLIDEAKGDIIFINDADDMSETNRIISTMAVFNKEPEIGVVYGDCAVINGLGFQHSTLGSQEMQVWKLKHENFVPHPTVAFRKSVGIKYRKDLNFIDDWYFYLDCIKHGIKFKYIPATLAVYRPIISGLTLKDGFSNKDKELKKEVLRQEFKDFDDDITENLKNKPQQKVRVKRILKEIANESKVLDLGSNGGYIAELLEKKGCQVKCYEIASNLVDICKAKGLDVERVDARNFNDYDSYDIVLAGDILEHMGNEDVKKVLENSYNALKKDGKFIATVPYKHSFYNADRIVEHIKDYSLDDFNKLFDRFEYKAEPIYVGDMSVSLWLFITGTKKEG